LHNETAGTLARSSFSGSVLVLSSGRFTLRLGCALLISGIRFLAAQADAVLQAGLSASTASGIAAAHGLGSALMVRVLGHSGSSKIAFHNR
jgi:hypothetical protein